MESGHEGGRGWVVAVWLLALTSPGWATANEERSEPRRRLGEHVFIPREAISDPFSTSFVGSETGFGYGTGGGPAFDLNGQQQWQFGGGIFYTGRTELTLGLEMVYNRAPLGAHDVFLASTLGLIVLRYNFN